MVYRVAQTLTATSQTGVHHQLRIPEDLDETAGRQGDESQVRIGIGSCDGRSLWDRTEQLQNAR
jgi:hypothetical protein